MIEPVERAQKIGQSETPLEGAPGKPPALVDTPMAVQQLREAGFSDDQQAALTTAFLRILALWTQQATRGDLQAELHAGEQRLTQQLDTWREEIRREVAQHAQTLREEMHGEFVRHADLVHTMHTQPARRSSVALWFITVLLVLTCGGVFWLVSHSMLGQ